MMILAAASVVVLFAAALYCAYRAGRADGEW